VGGVALRVEHFGEQELEGGGGRHGDQGAGDAEQCAAEQDGDDGDQRG